jgi:hypothetical protein
MTEEALHNIETARMIEHNNFPEFNYYLQALGEKKT